MSKFPIRLLGDLVVVQPLTAEREFIVHKPDWAKRLKGWVIATGPGKPLINGGAAPIEARPGDLVTFGAAKGMESVFAGREIRVMRDSDIDAVLEHGMDKDTYDALQDWIQSVQPDDVARNPLPPHLEELGAQIRATGENLFVKRFEYEHPVLAVVGIRLEKGVVVAAGPGRRQRRLVRFDKCAGHLSSEGSIYFEDGAETGKLHPMRVRVGDVVEFSPRNQTEVRVGGEELVVIKERACYGITNDSKAEAMLWQQSAGYDRKGNWMSDAESWQSGKT